MRIALPEHFWQRVIATLLAVNAVVLVLILVNRPDQPPTPGSGPATPIQPVQVKQLVPSPAPVIQASLWWDAVIANRDLSLVNKLGFAWVKQVFSWREIEPYQKGDLRWQQADQVVAAAEAHQLFVLARLDREPLWASASGQVNSNELTSPPKNVQDFGDFCYAFASRYRGRAVKAYQVWNEPNLAREWGSKPPNPAEYVKLLVACYQGIKKGDPDAIVISAGLAPTGTDSPEAMPDDKYLRGMYQAGAAAYFDMLGLNAPGYAAPPQASPDEVARRPEWGGYRWACFRHVEDMRQIMLENGDGSKQVAILETGWTTDKIHPTYSWFGVSEQQQAEYLAGAYWWARLNWQPWIGLMTTIYLADPYWTPEDEEYWWSISLPNFPEPVTRPAFRALSGMPQWDMEMYDKWRTPPQPGS